MSFSIYGNKILFIFCGEKTGIEWVSKNLDKLFSNISPIFVAGTKSFFNLAPENIFSGYNVTVLREEFHVKELIESYDAVVIPVLSLNTASKISKLITDNFVTNLIITGLLLGKKVIAFKKFLLPEDVIPSAGIKSGIDNIVQRLELFGVEFIDENLKITSDRVTCVLGETDCNACGLCVVKREEDVRKLIDAGVIRVSATTPIKEVPSELARYIDHTLLKPDATEEQIKKLCEEAKKYGFASVCVNPCWVEYATKLLEDSDVKVCTVIGFPLGATSAQTKVFEAEQAIRHGASEIDMVINVGALKSKNYALVEEDIRGVVEVARKYGALVKVIIETCLLTDEEKVAACSIAKSAGAHFVKTSTGFGSGGATLHDVELMRRVVGENVGVKASGGIRDFQKALDMIKAGATRIGASASVAIIQGTKGTSKY